MATQAVIVAGKKDNELLSDFCRNRNDEAFCELVFRHGPMILGIGKRVLRDEHDAEDVLQKVFLILMREGHKIHLKQRRSLSAWLYQVAYRASLRMLKSRVRGEQSPASGIDQTVCDSETEQWQQISNQEEQLVLLEELSQLPERYRETLVLCCIEELSRVESATRLNSSPEAIQKRVERGKEMLRNALLRRGVALSLTAVAVSLCACKSAVSPSLMTAVCSTCVSGVGNALSISSTAQLNSFVTQGSVLMKTASVLISLVGLAVLVDSISQPLGVDASSRSSGNLSLPSIGVNDSGLHQAGFQFVINGRASRVSGLQQELDDKIQTILDRQKGDTLKVFLKSSRAYVNGKSVSRDEMKTVIKELKLKKGEVTSEKSVGKSKLSEWLALLKSEGVTVERIFQWQQGDVAKEKLQKVLVTLKTKGLKIYLKGRRGIYANGTQIDKAILTDVIQKSEVKKATISTAAGASKENLREVVELLEKNGVQEVNQIASKEGRVGSKATTPPEKVREIVSRQKGPNLKIYLSKKGAYINGKSVKESDLKSILDSVSLTSAKIESEKDVAYKTIIIWMEAVRKNGITKLSLSPGKR